MSNDDVADSGYSSCLGINNRLHGSVLFTAYGKTPLSRSPLYLGLH